jgi:hypothetical protein
VINWLRALKNLEIEHILDYEKKFYDPPGPYFITSAQNIATSFCLKTLDPIHFRPWHQYFSYEHGFIDGTNNHVIATPPDISDILPSDKTIKKYVVDYNKEKETIFDNYIYEVGIGNFRPNTTWLGGDQNILKKQWIMKSRLANKFDKTPSQVEIEAILWFNSYERSNRLGSPVFGFRYW